MDTVPAIYQRQTAVVPTVDELFEGQDAWWQWYAIDSDGRGSYYESKPFLVRGFTYWGYDGGAKLGYPHIMDKVDWQACIYERPDQDTSDWIGMEYAQLKVDEYEQALLQATEELDKLIGDATTIRMPCKTFRPIEYALKFTRNGAPYTFFYTGHEIKRGRRMLHLLRLFGFKDVVLTRRV